jgi:hypothetical protein
MTGGRRLVTVFRGLNLFSHWIAISALESPITTWGGSKTTAEAFAFSGFHAALTVVEGTVMPSLVPAPVADETTPSGETLKETSLGMIKRDGSEERLDVNKVRQLYFYYTCSF